MCLTVFLKLTWCIRSCSEDTAFVWKLPVGLGCKTSFGKKQKEHNKGRGRGMSGRAYPRSALPLFLQQIQRPLDVVLLGGAMQRRELRLRLHDRVLIHENADDVVMAQLQSHRQRRISILYANRCTASGRREFRQNASKEKKQRCTGKGKQEHQSMQEKAAILSSVCKNYKQMLNKRKGSADGREMTQECLHNSNSRLCTTAIKPYTAI